LTKKYTALTAIPQIQPTLALRSADHQLLREALDELPVEFREVVVLRDMEGFSYKEIADIANIPAGTVMSRLARARERSSSWSVIV